MEYVEGEPADVYAARQSLEECLRLFVRIGEAVAHAHENGFIHRDLKPSNVLVRADGTPRLLDFGIARVDDSAAQRDLSKLDEQPLTRTGHRLFTPEYASPEQIRGEVATTRSDVFALRCLAKDPRQRYASVADLGEDVERHLDGRPIDARRTGLFGRGLRLARRRPAVPALLALLAIALTTGGVAWQLEQRDVRRRGELFASVEERIEESRSRRGEGRFVSPA